MATIWRENMLRYLSADIVCSEKRTVFRESSSRKTVSCEEKIMSKDKYPSISSPQMEAIVFIIVQIFLATRALTAKGAPILSADLDQNLMQGYSSNPSVNSHGVGSHILAPCSHPPKDNPSNKSNDFSITR